MILTSLGTECTGDYGDERNDFGVENHGRGALNVEQDMQVSESTVG